MKTLFHPMPGNTGSRYWIDRLPNPQTFTDAVTKLVAAAVLRGVHDHDRANPTIDSVARILQTAATRKVLNFALRLSDATQSPVNALEKIEVLQCP